MTGPEADEQTIILVEVSYAGTVFFTPRHTPVNATDVKLHGITLSLGYVRILRSLGVCVGSHL